MKVPQEYLNQFKGKPFQIFNLYHFNIGIGKRKHIVRRQFHPN